ncbi:hypothetical protein QO034_02250 [Sedimentitalea sp. JM2-8]|uniref:TIGR04222 domain-containing protein n=1 Tax=Sedimentitalea xiamensis TaxID=3050037 RepID=A0ABT7F9Y4_9RHOB|nr:hypothetical protein [Sedimentitalea xiamensis]MDK3071921.1 hypothetical protein [Sedimentitalea xiamensis]
MTEIAIYLTGLILILGVWLQYRRFLIFDEELSGLNEVFDFPFALCEVLIGGTSMEQYRAAKVTVLQKQLSVVSTARQSGAPMVEIIDSLGSPRRMPTEGATGFLLREIGYQEDEIRHLKFWRWIKYNLHALIILAYAVGFAFVGVVQGLDRSTLDLWPVVGALGWAVAFSLQWVFSWIFLSVAIALFIVDFIQTYTDQVTLVFVRNIAHALAENPDLLCGLAVMLVSAAITSLVDVVELVSDTRG